jgi:hypothetical protein
MRVISVFRQSIQVELAVTALEEEGFTKNDILAVPVEKALPGKKLFDSMYAQTGDSVFDLAMLLGALAMLFGSIYGFRLSWGPVLWGMIGGTAGFAAGLIVKLLLLKKKKTAGLENEVVILVACDAGKTEQVKKLLRDNGALGVSLIACADKG